MNGQIIRIVEQTPVQEMTLSSLVGNIKSLTLSLQVTLASHVIATIVDDLEDHNFNDCVLEFLLQERSYLFLKMRSVQALSSVSSLGNHDVILPARTTIMTDDMASSATEVSRNLVIRLIGEHAQANVRYACYGTGEKKFKFITLQDHQAEHCISNVVVRSVLDDNAKIFCKGLIHIKNGAQHPRADLENKNVLLGQGSRAVSIPTLEIEANDVVCKHGAAISKLDAEQFFYLQSRGIAVQQARTMLIESFLTL